MFLAKCCPIPGFLLWWNKMLWDGWSKYQLILLLPNSYHIINLNALNNMLLDPWVLVWVGHFLLVFSQGMTFGLSQLLRARNCWDNSSKILYLTKSACFPAMPMIPSNSVSATLGAEYGWVLKVLYQLGFSSNSFQLFYLDNTFMVILKTSSLSN